MKTISALIFAAYIAVPLAASAEDRAPQLPPIDAGSVWNQINHDQHPFPQPSPTTLDTCAFTELKNDKCYFKCQSGDILTEPTITPGLSTGQPAGTCAYYIIRPIPSGFKNKAGVDMTITRPLMMAKMQSNTLKTISLMLKGLEQQNSPNMAPAEYTNGVADATEAVEEALLNIDQAISEKNPAMLHMETVRLEPVIEKLASLPKTIEGSANYAYWGGDAIKKIAAELGRNINEIRLNAPFAF